MARCCFNLATVNRGVDGQRIDQMVTRPNEMLHQLEPSTMLLLIGIADILWPAITPGQQMANYTLLFAALRSVSTQARLVLRTLLPAGRKYGESMPAVLAFNGILSELVASQVMTGSITTRSLPIRRDSWPLSIRLMQSTCRPRATPCGPQSSRR